MFDRIRELFRLIEAEMKALPLQHYRALALEIDGLVCHMLDEMELNLTGKTGSSMETKQ